MKNMLIGGTLVALVAAALFYFQGTSGNETTPEYSGAVYFQDARFCGWRGHAGGWFHGWRGGHGNWFHRAGGHHDR